MYYYELQKIGIDLGSRTSGRAKVTCPKCAARKPGTRKKDLSVNIDEGLYKCHNSNCDFSGRVRTTTYSKPDTKPNTTSLPDKTVRFFEGRGISQHTLKKMNVGVDSYGNIVFSYLRNGDLVNTKTRKVKDGKKTFFQHSGAEKIVYNLDSLTGKTKCIFVEGEMDVLTWVEAGVSSEYGVISVDIGAPAPGQNVGTKLDCLQNCAHELDGIEEFYLCTDKDAPGQYLQELLIERLGAYRCNVVELPSGYKDANELLEDENFEKAQQLETLRLQLKNAKAVPVPGIHTLDDVVQEQMLHNFHNGRQRGETTHYSDIDFHFTMLPGDLTCWTGIPSSGKGQLIRQLALIKAVKDGWKWAFFAPEDFPVDIFFDDVIHALVGKSPYKEHSNQMTEEEYREAMNFVKDHFFLIHPEADKKTGEIKLPSNDWLNDQIRFLRLKYGVNAYVKDPWNKIYHNFHNREDQYLAKELSREKFFAMQFDAAWYVAHPKEPPRLKEGGFEVPHPYSISGGAMWFNMCDNHISVHRPNIHNDPKDKITLFRSTKIKKQKLVGRPGDVNLFFEVLESRYYQMSGGVDYCPLTEPRADLVSSSMVPAEDLPF